VHSTGRLLVLTTAALLIGCSGENMSAGQTMSAEEYFAELDVIAQTTDDAFSQLEQETSDALEGVTSDDEVAGVFRRLLEDSVAIVETTLTQLEESSPPDEVADVHAAFVNSIRAQLDTFQRLVDDYNEIGYEGAIAAIQRGEIESLEQATDEACVDLQAIADGSSIDVDLGCGG
jgi:hypothetical protein